MATNPFQEILDDPNSLLRVKTAPKMAIGNLSLPYYGLPAPETIKPQFEDIYIGGARPNPGFVNYGYGQTPFDLDALVEEFRQRRIARVNAENAARMQQISREAPANVAGRRQSLIEFGRMGPQPLANPRAADRAIIDRLPAAQYQQLREAVEAPPETVKAVPGIGNLTNYDGARVMTGRYGTGVATNEPRPNPNRTIEGIPAAQWFAKKAGEQGVSNKFAVAVPTGVTDAQDPWGIKPRFTGKAIVEQAMKKKKS